MTVATIVRATPPRLDEIWCTSPDSFVPPDAGPLTVDVVNTRADRPEEADALACAEWVHAKRDCASLCRTACTPASLSASSAILRTDESTVVWSRSPKARPMCHHWIFCY